MEGEVRIPHFLRGGGAMGAAIRAYDWAASGLGAPEGWPPALRTALRLLLDSSHPMYLAWGPRLLCFCNDAYCAASGDDGAAALGRPAREVWHWAWDIIGPQLGQVLGGGEPVWCENALVPIGRDGRGEEAYWTYSYSPVEDPAAANGVGGVLCVCTVTTAVVQAQRRRERELHEQRRLLEQVPGFVVVMRGPQHVVEFANDAHRAMFGSGGWIGKPVREAIPGIEGEGFFEILDRVYASGEPVQLQDREIRFRRGPDAGEETRYINVVYTPWTDEDGRIAGVFSDGLDVSARIAAERALEHSRQQSDRQRRLYEAILANTPDLAYVFDLQHRFVYANDMLVKMWRTTREQALGKTCLELGYPPWHAEMHSREIERVVATRQPVRGQVPFDGAFGLRIYDYILVPVLNASGAVEAVAGTSRDVTELRESEQRLRQIADALADADRRKTQFLAMLAHELRNPLAPLANGLAILRGAAGAGAPVRGALEMMQRQVDHMVRLIDDLIDISRISQGSISLRLERMDLAAVVQQAVDTCRPLIDAARQALVVELPPAPLALDGDPVRLTQVVSNLLNNASRFSGRGAGIVLRVAREGGQAVITVSDQGVGIPPEMLTRVFEMFIQLERSAEHSRSGLGIGLALVKTLVELHGGSVEARSAGPGCGSDFVVRLPLPAQAAAAAAAPALPAPPVGGLRVLVADDNQDSADSMARVLQLLGNEVHTAYDGLAAVQAAADFAPDLVLLDIGLPGIDGHEACRRILAHSARRPLMVAVTGWGYSEDRQRSAAAGFDAHLVKPVDYAELSRLIGERLAPPARVGASQSIIDSRVDT